MMDGREGALRSNAFGLAALMAMITMLFVTFTAAMLVRRASPDWRPVSLPQVVWLNTGLLVLSSLTAEAARRSGRAAWAWVTIGLGLTFAAGQGWAWHELNRRGVFLATSPHASFFYMLTAVHGLHLFGGLGAWLHVVARGRRAGGVTCAFWHFLGGLWIYVLIVLTVLR